MLKGCMEFGIQIQTKSMQKEELREHYSWFYICKKVGCMSKILGDIILCKASFWANSEKMGIWMQGHKYWHFCNFLILYFEKNLGFLPSKLECKSSSLVYMDIECL